MSAREVLTAFDARSIAHAALRLTEVAGLGLSTGYTEQPRPMPAVGAGRHFAFVLAAIPPIPGSVVEVSRGVGTDGARFRLTWRAERPLGRDTLEADYFEKFGEGAPDGRLLCGGCEVIVRSTREACTRWTIASLLESAADRARMADAIMGIP